MLKKKHFVKEISAIFSEINFFIDILRSTDLVNSLFEGQHSTMDICDLLLPVLQCFKPGEG